MDAAVEQIRRDPYARRKARNIQCCLEPVERRRPRRRVGEILGIERTAVGCVLLLVQHPISGCIHVLEFETSGGVVDASDQ